MRFIGSPDKPYRSKLTIVVSILAPFGMALVIGCRKEMAPEARGTHVKRVHPILTGYRAILFAYA
jgi:hypothetical protein